MKIRHKKNFKISNKMKALLFCLFGISFVEGFLRPFHPQNHVIKSDPYKYPLSRDYYERYVKRLNSRNVTIQTNEILQQHEERKNNATYRIIINKNMFNSISSQLFPSDEDQEDGDNYNDLDDDFYKKARNSGKKGKKSENFEVITDSDTNFTCVGGYDTIKSELAQCIDLLTNYTKYAKFNVRVPKGLIFEGPPGNGKTLLAKALAGEAKTGFIAVSGSQFQEMYVGVGSSRIRELFQLAEKNIPCIIFIDEIDALGRNRGSSTEMSSVERDSTLNELLVSLDGFKTKAGVFLIGATNRADLLDAALTRPGRIDKKIFIGNPDEVARLAIIKIHSQGKPRDNTINDDDLVEITNGFSAAQIENLLNEAMLNALRYDREVFTQADLDVVYNKVLVGWQPSDHIFTDEMLDKITVHEMGHAIVGLLAKNHSKVKKVIINLSSPNAPGYTLFEKSKHNIYNRDTLFEHLMVLLGGRIAEELFYGPSAVSTGAISDFEEALALASKMITYYGMGDHVIYPNNSEKYKEIIDNEITKLLEDAYTYASIIIDNSKDFIYECALLLKEKRVITREKLLEIIKNKYADILDIRM
uniref:AAA+ ATPase domain-containing protein n=1 Tax=viral metagenome TaxID=1070528 RepID=A0A6C0AS07_9ZZZZ